MKRTYCEGTLTKQMLAAQLDVGFVLVDLVRNGYSGGDVAYYREGTPAEIESCRSLLTAATQEPR